MTNNIENIPELLKLFKHTTRGYVKFHEVDSFKVVHNLKYLQWTEDARVEYCHEVGISILPTPDSASSKHFSIFLVHNEINYFNPASYFEEYIIYTRVSKIGKTSMTFEHIVTKKDNTILCMNVAVEVYVDGKKRPLEIDNEIKKLVLKYEKENSVMLK